MSNADPEYRQFSNDFLKPIKDKKKPKIYVAIIPFFGEDGARRFIERNNAVGRVIELNDLIIKGENDGLRKPAKRTR